ncbi:MULTISPECIES: YqzM family protein [Paenibacillus]|uniref:YqzM family protein n=1 Tax=Paenibacillus whitsoniae TaxID=2496558 RepID=A0A430JCS4_9BACL|nr:YqzM family protein [Paenibacillus whitsoniae]RTE08811.1 YqzM family protein [Paenibacillus whitsoniae]
MSDPKHPELHVYEEPRNDLMDVGMGFGVFFGILFVIAIIATIIEVANK